MQLALRCCLPSAARAILLPRIALEALACTGYLAPRFLREYLRDELEGLGGFEAAYDRLFLAAGAARPAYWVQNLWLEPLRLPVDSITDAARKLRAIQRNWAPYLFQLHRRGVLIQEQLPSLPTRPRSFPLRLPDVPMGAWTLIDERTVLASPCCSSPLPNGEIHFVENHSDPPSRAYLKLWELFTVLRSAPGPGDSCLDFGASPGSWTWVLHALGARVTSVDRAPLEPRIARLPGVRHIRHNAFSLKPADFGPVDWFFSDVVAYPGRLWSWIEGWLAAGTCGHFVCTIKVQGRPERSLLEPFAAVPGARLMHLCHNRHELTWVLLSG
jgi:23S rRNA (cytidine2498-2'-O)-methyltransferase